MTEGYDDAKALDEYLSRNLHALMTDDERREFYFAMKRSKTQSGTDIELAELRRFQTVVLKIRNRIQRDIWGGRVIVNRCPKCSGIARTPLAKQCLSCGFDWHT